MVRNLVRDCTVHMIDTALQGKNERLLGELLKDPSFRSKAFICTKFGASFNENNGLIVSGKPEYVRQCCEESLRNLQVDYIDL
jgi:aryl-alcohol dehydrogenase-like predicted oxidoreductase